ncbi:MAG: hypothetical protein ABH859_08415 [Pseudomonadota bacterium]
MKQYYLIISSLAILLISSCGGGSGGGTTTVVDVNTLDGQTDVAVNEPFRYTFSGTVANSSITTASFFIVETPAAAANLAAMSKATFNPAICDVSNALAASVTSAVHSPTASYADLTPASDLVGSGGYTVCLTSDIQVDGNAFAGFQASFNTVGGGGGGGGGTQTERLKITNNCSYAIWIQQQNMPSSVPAVVKLDAGESHEWAIPEAGQASTRFWPKTGCDGSGQNCTIGQSSDPCTNCPPPVDSKLESTWGCVLSNASQCGTTPQGNVIGDTYWNMSAVDGYTLPFTTSVTDNTTTDSGAPCEAVDCSSLDFNQCPTTANLSEGRTGTIFPQYASADLRVKNTSDAIIGCYSPCKKFNYPTYDGYGLAEDSDPPIIYCCPTPYSTDAECEAHPDTCVTSAQCRAGPGASNGYVTAIHAMCNNSTYAYAYDDNYGLRHCSAATKVHVTFGPNCP